MTFNLVYLRTNDYFEIINKMFEDMIKVLENHFKSNSNKKLI